MNRLKQNKCLLSSILLIVSIAFTLILGEFVLRDSWILVKEAEPISDRVQFNIHWGLEPLPGLKYKEYGFTVRTNKHSMYGPEIPKLKKGMRVAYLGDSYTVGPGIPFKKNYPTLATQALKKDFGDELDMVIGAIAGSSPSQQKIILEKKILNFEPNLIIYEAFANDVKDDVAFNHSSYLARIHAYKYMPKVLLNLRSVQHATVFFSEQLSRYWRWQLTKSSQLTLKEKWENYSKPALDKILNIAESNNIKFILIWIPDGTVFTHEYGPQVLEQAPLQAKHALLVQGLISQWAEENNVSYVNMYETLLQHNTLEPNELYLPQELGYHLTEFAASLVAKKIINLVREGSHNNLKR